MKIAQYALEYMAIMAVTLMIIVPTAYLFFNHMKQSNTEISYAQIQEIGNSIISNAELIFYSGEFSKMILDINLPEHLRNVYILHNRELIFEIESDLGLNELIYFSDINLTSNSCNLEVCNLSLQSSGPIQLQLESVDGGSKILIEKV